jgi:hypothetical protein
MMPGFLPWVFIALFCYGACLFLWAGIKQKRRGKIKSSRYLLTMGGVLAVSAIFFLARRLLRLYG